jgi:hypothetical protein
MVSEMMEEAKEKLLIRYESITSLLFASLVFPYPYEEEV